MILKSLYDYAKLSADSVPPQGMEWKEIEFVIVIDENGNFVRFESRRLDKKKCASFLVPKGVKRSSAPKSNILWDNGKYVLGIDEKIEKAKICNELFIDIVNDIYDRFPDDISIQALKKFYQQPDVKRNGKLAEDPLYETVCNSLSSNFSFRLESDDVLISEKNYLYSHIIRSVPKDSIISRCLITGEYGPVVRTTTPTPIPDNSPMASLVSFQVNSGYDSYGKSQAFNAPISIEAEEAYSSVLKKFLGKDSKNKIRLGNRMFLFWGSGSSSIFQDIDSGLMNLLSIPDKDNTRSNNSVLKVEKLFKAIYSGEIRTTLDDRFNILGLAPNTGRISVVMWMECELREFASMIIKHFTDMEIKDSRPLEKKRPYQGVFSIISAATLGGKVSDALPRMIEETVKAVISGGPYPYILFSQVLQRIRAELSESTVSLQRAAILKACINRISNNNSQNKQLTIMLDKTNTNPGYLCGRLTAVLEKIQTDVKSGDSIRTRYMGAASATPAAVFPAMLNVSLHHSEKLSEGSRIYFEQLKQEIIDKISDKGFPAHLDLNDQGRFFVGYYHQRSDLYSKKEN